MHRNTTIVLALTAAMVFTLMPEMALAAKLSAPPWVDTPNASDLQDAGDEINKWIFVFMGVVVALSSVKPGYLFIRGKAQEGMEAAIHIVYGVVIAVVLGGLAFAVAGKMGG